MAELNKSEVKKKMIKRINEVKGWLFEKVTKIHRMLAGLRKKKREDSNEYHQK